MLALTPFVKNVTHYILYLKSMRTTRTTFSSLPSYHFPPSFTVTLREAFSFPTTKSTPTQGFPSCRNAFSSYFFFLFSHTKTATAVKTTKIPTPLKNTLTLTPEEIIIINNSRNASQNPQPSFPGFLRLLIVSSYLTHLIANSLTSLSLSLCR